LRRGAHPLELLLDLALPRRLLLLLDLEALLLRLEPRAVVPLERVGLAAVELEDPLRHVVEEVAVVRDRHDGPGYCARCCSSHATLSASRWFVGSSRSRRSGFWSSVRHSATRRFSPPER